MGVKSTLDLFPRLLRGLPDFMRKPDLKKEMNPGINDPSQQTDIASNSYVQIPLIPLEGYENPDINFFNFYYRVSHYNGDLKFVSFHIEKCNNPADYMDSYYSGGNFNIRNHNDMDYSYIFSPLIPPEIPYYNVGARTDSYERTRLNSIDEIEYNSKHFETAYLFSKLNLNSVFRYNTKFFNTDYGKEAFIEYAEDILQAYNEIRREYFEINPSAKELLDLSEENVDPQEQKSDVEKRQLSIAREGCAKTLVDLAIVSEKMQNVIKTREKELIEKIETYRFHELREELYFARKANDLERISKLEKELINSYNTARFFIMNDKFEEVLDPDIFKDCKGDSKENLDECKNQLEKLYKENMVILSKYYGKYNEADFVDLSEEDFEKLKINSERIDFLTKYIELNPQSDNILKPFDIDNFQPRVFNPDPALVEEGKKLFERNNGFGSYFDLFSNNLQELDEIYNDRLKILEERKREFKETVEKYLSTKDESLKEDIETLAKRITTIDKQIDFMNRYRDQLLIMEVDPEDIKKGNMYFGVNENGEFIFEKICRDQGACYQKYQQIKSECTGLNELINEKFKSNESVAEERARLSQMEAQMAFLKEYLAKYSMGKENYEKMQQILDVSDVNPPKENLTTEEKFNISRKLREVMEFDKTPDRKDLKFMDFYSETKLTKEDIFKRIPFDIAESALIKKENDSVVEINNIIKSVVDGEPLTKSDMEHIKKFDNDFIQYGAKENGKIQQIETLRDAARELFNGMDEKDRLTILEYSRNYDDIQRCVDNFREKYTSCIEEMKNAEDVSALEQERLNYEEVLKALDNYVDKISGVDKEIYEDNWEVIEKEAKVRALREEDEKFSAYHVLKEIDSERTAEMFDSIEKIRENIQLCKDDSEEIKKAVQELVELRNIRENTSDKEEIAEIDSSYKELYDDFIERYGAYKFVSESINEDYMVLSERIEEKLMMNEIMEKVAINFAKEDEVIFAHTDIEKLIHEKRELENEILSIKVLNVEELSDGLFKEEKLVEDMERRGIKIESETIDLQQDFEQDLEPSRSEIGGPVVEDEYESEKLPNTRRKGIDLEIGD